MPAWMPALGLGIWTGHGESRRDMELQAGAVMQGTALSLPVWFWCVKSLQMPTVTMGMERQRLECATETILPVPVASEHRRSPALQHNPCLGTAHGLLPVLVAWDTGHGITDLNGAWRGEAVGLASPVPPLSHGGVCLGEPLQPQPGWQSGMLVWVSLGMALGCQVPPES